MNFKEQVIQFFQGSEGARSERALQAALKLNTAEERQLGRLALRELEAEGTLVRNERGDFAFVPEERKVRGRLQGHRKGFAFLIREDGQKPDLFVAPGKLNGAIHGDLVLCEDLGEREEARVLCVLERGHSEIVGSFEPSKNFGFVVPDDDRFGFDILVKGRPGLPAREKVVARLLGEVRSGRNPEGKIVEVLGPAGRATDILSIVRAHGLREEFPAAVEKEARKLDRPLDKKDFKNREDLTGKAIVTIDGIDSRDLDDAVSLERRGENFLLGVHIADVSHYVRPGSLLDEEAQKRGTSVYFPDRVYPMLPKALSNGICSLNEGVPRLTLSVFMEVDRSGKVVASRLSKSVISTAHRMNYPEVTALLEGDRDLAERYADVAPMLFDMRELAEILFKKRVRRGSVEMDLPEMEVKLGPDGEIERILPADRGISHKIIEEFMILCNETVAEALQKAGAPCLYRVHEKPEGEKLQGFAEFVQGLGLTLPLKKGGVTSKTYADLLASLKDGPLYRVVNTVMLRSMMKARYCEFNLGHFGLCSAFYCHFTSPIRRYPDLFVHRMLKKLIKGTAPQAAECLDETRALALRCSASERTADLAEREVDDYYKAEYMKKHLGEEFEGHISGVTEFGIFVELENTVEGLIRLEHFPADDYEFDQKMYRLRGRLHTFALGDPVRIAVAGVSQRDGKVEFAFAGLEEVPSDRERTSRRERGKKAGAGNAAPEEGAGKKPRKGGDSPKENGKYGKAAAREAGAGEKARKGGRSPRGSENDQAAARGRTKQGTSSGAGSGRKRRGRPPKGSI